MFFMPIVSWEESVWKICLVRSLMISLAICGESYRSTTRPTNSAIGVAMFS
jgi:hypothetical protein